MSAFKWFEFDPDVNIWDQMTELHAAHVKTGVAYTPALRQFLQEDVDRVMRWISIPPKEDMDTVFTGQINVLRAGGHR